LLAAAFFFAATIGAQAATLTKANTTTMNVAADWGGTTPAAGNTGQFDATISAPNAAALNPGGQRGIGLVSTFSAHERPGHCRGRQHPDAWHIRRHQYERGEFRCDA